MWEQVGIKRLDHVCWAVRRLDDAMPLLTELLGMRTVDEWSYDEGGFIGVTLEVPGQNVFFEVLAPIGEDNSLARFLDKRGPGLHHVTFQVGDLQKTMEAMRAYGVEPYGDVTHSHGWAYTYMHPSDSGGVLFQFYVEDDDG